MVYATSNRKTRTSKVVNIVGENGDEDTDGSWRFIPTGDNLNAEKRESGEWIPKGGFTA